MNKIISKTAFRYLLLLSGAVLTALTLVFPAMGIIEWVSLVPAAAVFVYSAFSSEISKRKIYLYGFVFFTAFYLVIYHWFCYLYPLSFTGMSEGAALVVVLLAWIGISLFQASIMAFIPVLFCSVARKNSLFATRKWLLPFVAGGIWAVFEWGQKLGGWLGLPWAKLALGQVRILPALQSASVFGAYFITFLLVSSAFFLAFVCLYGEKRRKFAAIASALMLGNLLVGVVLMGFNGIEKGEKITVAAIQGNISSTDKWSSDTKYIREKHLELIEAAAKEGADLIVLAETAIPVVMSDSDYTVETIAALSKEYGITVLVGAFEYEDAEASDMLGNAIVAINPDGSVNETVYLKRHLVPFGEYMPLREFLTWLIPPLGEIAMLDEDIAAGKDSEVMDTAVGRLGSLICFDSIYEELALDSVSDGAQLICISTNDSWFFDSAAVYMHNGQAQLRAVETNRYIVRAANTGISSIITPSGEITEQLPPLVEGYALSQVYLRDTRTVYSYIGNAFIYIIIAILVIMTGIDLYLKLKKVNSAKSVAHKKV